MNIPLNQEHKEAEQLKTNKERDAFIKSLPKKQQKQFAAVDKAAALLLEADVPFYLFPMLPSRQFKGKMQVWQWNSLAAQMKYDKSGKPTRTSEEHNSMFHEGLFGFLFNQFSGFFMGDNLTEKLSSLPYFFSFCINKHRNYLNDTNEDEKGDKD